MRISTPHEEDLRHTLEVFAHLHHEPPLRGQRLIAEASGSRVTIHGFVSDDELRELAVMTARALPWVETVHTYITVEEDKEADRPEEAPRPRSLSGPSAGCTASETWPSRPENSALSRRRRMKGVGV